MTTGSRAVAFIPTLRDRRNVDVSAAEPVSLFRDIRFDGRARPDAGIPLCVVLASTVISNTPALRTERRRTAKCPHAT